MKRGYALIVFFSALLVSGYCHAQIQGNLIAYYPFPAGSCGQPGYTAADSIKGSSAASGLKGGSGSFTYQWEQSLDQGITFNLIKGAVQAAYFPGTIFHTTLYLRIVRAGNDSSTSNAISLFVSPASISGNTIHQNKTNLSVFNIACGILLVDPGTLTGPVPTGSSNANYAYSWASSTDNGATYLSRGIRATAFDYTPKAVSTTTWFIRIVHSGACVDTSAPVKFIFGGIDGNLITAPSVISVCGAVELTPGMISGSLLPASYTYQWESGPDSTHFSAISGAITQNYDPGTLFSSTAFRRRCLTGSCNSVTNALLFTVVPPFSLNAISILPGAQAADPIVFSGKPVTAGSASIRYRWEQSTDSLLYTAVAGNTNFLNFQLPASLVKTWYRRVALSGACSVLSNSVSSAPVLCDTCQAIPAGCPTGGCPVQSAGCSVGALKANMGIHLTRRPGNKGQGLTFDYTLSASNYGPERATHIVISDTLSSTMNETGITAVENGTATFNAYTHILTWKIASMASSSIATMILSVQPVNNDQLISKMSISADQCDPDPVNNTFRDTINHPLSPVNSAPLIPAYTSSIPDIITPNGDGKNDRFIIPKILETGNADNQINIFDRWGNTVFAVNGYQNTWDGKGLSAGTYFYVLKISTGGNPQLIKGFITLMR